MGINHGWGADTFFYKQLRQRKRAGPVAFIGTSTMVLFIVNAISVFFVRSLGDFDELTPDMLMLILLGVSSYLLFFTNIASDWMLELQKPYIYLIPAKPFDKLLWASLTSLLEPAINGALVFAIFGMILHAGAAAIVICTLAYASVGFLFTAGNVLSQRLFGKVISKGITMFLYMMVIMLLIAPGAVFSIVLSIFAPWVLPPFLLLPIAIWNILVSLGIFAACRNLLSTVEFSN